MDNHPVSSTAESGVISGILANKDVIYDIVPLLAPDDFTEIAYRQLYESMLRVHNSGNIMDVRLIAIDLKEHKSMVSTEFLENHLGAFMPKATIMECAHKVRELADRRAAIVAAECFLAKARDMSLSMSEVLGNMPDVVDAMAGAKRLGGMQRLSDIAFDMITKIQENIMPNCIETYLDDLNKIIGGFHSGEMITLAGRPGTGKTALALNIATQAMLKGKSVGFFSLEMSQTQLIERMCASLSKVDAQKFRTRKFEGQDHDDIMRFYDLSKKMNGKVYDSTDVDINTIRAECRKWKRQDGLDLVVVDYLQLVKSTTRGRESSREREVAEISRGIKQLAIELGVPVLLLAQLNRRVEGDSNKTPRLSDLRESGAIEQDSDVVLFLTPWGIGDGSDLGVGVDLVVAKSRSSRTGIVKLVYMRKQLNFVPQAYASKYSDEISTKRRYNK